MCQVPLDLAQAIECVGVFAVIVVTGWALAHVALPPSRPYPPEATADGPDARERLTLLDEVEDDVGEEGGKASGEEPEALVQDPPGGWQLRLIPDYHGTHCESGELRICSAESYGKKYERQDS